MSKRKADLSGKRAIAIAAGLPKGDAVPSNTVSNYIQRLKHIDDKGLASQAAQDHAETLFRKEHGAEYQHLIEEKPVLQSIKAHLQAILEKALERKQNTDPFAIMEDERSLSEARIPFSQWRTEHRISLIVLLAAAAITVGIGFSNIFSTLMASGEPVYLQSPWLAALTASSLPLASLAIERMYHFFKLDVTRYRYVMAVFSSTAIFAVWWVLAFSSQFDAVGTGFSFDDLDGGGKDTNLVRIQLLLEMFTAASLGLAVDQICRRYSPDSNEINPERLKNDEAVIKAEAEYLAAANRYYECTARIEELDAIREQIIEQCESDLLAVFAAHAQTQNL